VLSAVPQRKLSSIGESVLRICLRHKRQGCRSRVAPLEQRNVRRGYLWRFKYGFDNEGIETLFSHVKVVPMIIEPIKET